MGFSPIPLWPLAVSLQQMLINLRIWLGHIIVYVWDNGGTTKIIVLIQKIQINPKQHIFRHPNDGKMVHHWDTNVIGTEKLRGVDLVKKGLLYSIYRVYLGVLQLYCYKPHKNRVQALQSLKLGKWWENGYMIGILFDNVGIWTKMTNLTVIYLD